MTGTRRQPDAGITLVEVLVVLAVIGAATGGAMMAIGDRGQNAETEAVRLARHMTLALDEVLIGGLPLALIWDADGYSFVRYPEKQVEAAIAEWPPATPMVLGRRHDLPGGLALELRDESSAAAILLATGAAANSVTFDISGGAAPWQVTFDGFVARALTGRGS